MKRVSWVQAVGGAVAAEVGQIAAAVGWVAIYSYLVNPGHDGAFYEAYAQTAAPWVSMVAGAPIFYLTGRFIGRSRANAAGLFGVFFVLDAGLIVASGGLSGAAVWQAPLGYVVKLGACLLGGRHGERTKGRDEAVRS